MAAVENSRHNKTAFLTLPFELGSVAVFSLLVAILETSVTYIMISFIVYLLEQAKNVGLGKVRLELTLDDKTIEFKGSEWRLYSCHVR